MIRDSVITHQDEKQHFNRKRIIKVRPYPTATTEDILDFCKPIARRKPDVLIVHAGTNDLNKKDEKVIVDNILKIRETISEISPTTKTLISTIINRFDSKNFNDKIVFVNNRLEQVISKCDLIDNSNIDKDCIVSKR